MLAIEVTPDKTLSWDSFNVHGSESKISAAGSLDHPKSFIAELEAKLAVSSFNCMDFVSLP